MRQVLGFVPRDARLWAVLFPAAFVTGPRWIGLSFRWISHSIDSVDGTWRRNPCGGGTLWLLAITFVRRGHSGWCRGDRDWPSSACWAPVFGTIRGLVGATTKSVLGRVSPQLSCTAPLGRYSDPDRSGTLRTGAGPHGRNCHRRHGSDRARLPQLQTPRRTRPDAGAGNGRRAVEGWSRRFHRPATDRRPGLGAGDRGAGSAVRFPDRLPDRRVEPKRDGARRDRDCAPSVRAR